jgi:hypothetical protein
MDRLDYRNLDGFTAAMLNERNRQVLTIRLSAHSASVTNLATSRGVNRNFGCRHTQRVGTAWDDTSLSAAPDEAVLFALTVSKPGRTR